MDLKENFWEFQSSCKQENKNQYGKGIHNWLLERSRMWELWGFSPDMQIFKFFFSSKTDNNKKKLFL